ncbi:MAG: 4Fe-4S binding protein [Candidatus Omnitrophica bacterium]|nr:4Fe-4S binding protein [Candidatus Omnitrophota bacterium]
MPKIKINREKCKGCLLCISVCPKQMIKQDSALNKRGVKPVKFEGGAACVACAMCVVICPDGCIEVFKEE